MVKKRTTKKRKTTKKANLSINIAGAVLVLVSILALFKFGVVGKFLTNIYRIMVGDSYYVLAILLIILGSLLFAFGKFPKIAWKKLTGIILLYISLLIILHAVWFGKMNIHNDIVKITWNAAMEDMRHGITDNPLGGGMIGAAFYNVNHMLFAQVGTYFVASLIAIVGILMTFDIKMQQVINAAKRAMLAMRNSFGAAKKKTKAVNERFVSDEETKVVQEPEVKPEPQIEDVNIFAQEETPTPSSEFKIDSYQPTTTPEPEEKEVDDIPDFETAAHTNVDNSDYQLPSMTLLSDVKKVDQSSEFQKIEDNKNKLQATFKSFGVNVEVKKATLGPTVTKYEIQPAVGVKVSKIVNLADDLALALAAKDIRIEAPIPGKPFVGIEVPNQKSAAVGFKDVTENQNDKNNPMEVPLGKDVTGNIISSDISKMPHLLIAGSTGSGKSVAINTIITGILMKAKPNEVKFILIDPKMVELNVYNGIPHLLIPVVTDARRATGALQKAVSEMERRYKLFAETNNRNITEYNQEVETYNATNPEQPMEKLPYVILIVDELSDLMMTAGREVEAAIVRLAQMARAAGMHIIIATQRPSVDVITGLIKANVPSRIAFAVSSGIDSRTILDANGAEKLLGRGDMLYRPIGKNKPVRIQGSYITEEDVEKVVNFVKEQQQAQYDETMIPSDEPEIQDSNGSDANGKDNVDEYWYEALDLIINQQSASVSMLQRRFQIGYNRAARMVDTMEDKGLVGPSEGSKGRKVLITQEELEAMQAQENSGE
ncbi:DNA translocase FtsK [Companilactobacillus sp. RD055328]|uniref:DNA translocase FtsK n=1 Tax=Companilactobacillus sp. RD055328 TaxID=2916634 RepID=UPI001FC84DA5|nr:DNA translocase FtsK [Companilactobacillus sp. RD055328]GKQ43073.1 DNA translocase FtsK [Companilactobacillus sp. RD055328]